MKKTLITLAAIAAALTTLSAPAIASAQPTRAMGGGKGASCNGVGAGENRLVEGF